MDVEDLRLAVYEQFRRGEIPRVAGLATELSTTQDQLNAGLATLAAGRHVALGRDGEITMAHPFSAIPLGFLGDGPGHPLVGRLRVSTPAVTSASSAPSGA